MQRKKIMYFKPTAGLEYLPAKLSQGIEWYVYFYIKDPVTQKMRRVRITITQKQFRTRTIL